MTATEVQDVLLVGFGAVGTIYALILQRSGHARVTAVARSNFDAIQEHGVRIESGKYGVINGWRPDRMFRSVNEAADRPYTYVFVASKAIPERATTPSVLKPLLSAPYADEYSQPTYILLQNGIGVESDLYHAIKNIGKEPRIISTALWINTNLLQPNVVEHGTVDRLIIGVYRHNDYTTVTNTPAEAALLEDLSSILTAGGTNVTITPEVQRQKFSKNFWNVAFSSYSTLTRYRLPALFREPPSDPAKPYTPYVSPTTAHLIEEYTIPTIRATLEELVVLARALGYPDSIDGIPSTLPDDVIENTRKLHVGPDSFHKPSMMIDAERNQPLEVEVIFGAVVRLAQERGVPLPRVEMLYALLLVIQNQILGRLDS